MENDVRAMIAAEVRAELARQRKTQREAAAALAMTQPALQLRLSGQRAFRAEELAVLADWLGVPAGQFMPQADARPGAQPTGPTGPAGPRPTGPSGPRPTGNPGPRPVSPPQPRQQVA